MPNVVPSDVVAAIDDFFGPRRSELNSDSIQSFYQTEVQSVLALLQELPKELITLSPREYLELKRSAAVLEVSVVKWNRGVDYPVEDRSRKDPLETIRRLLAKCSDLAPPPEPELPFISDLDLRNGIQDRIQAAWIDFGAREWMGATVIAGNAMEALLLWALKQLDVDQSSGVERTQRDEALDKRDLVDLIKKAANASLISQATATQAGMARDSRNLLHPGRVSRSGTSCTKASALTALTAIYRIIEDFKAPLSMK